MKIQTAAFVALLALAGCDQHASEATQESAQAAQAKGKLQLSDGSSLLLNGSHLKSYAKPNSAGKLSMHEFSYPSMDKMAENDVYMHMQKAGYTRKVISNANNQYKVQYYKKDLPVVGGIYTMLNRDAKTETVATLYWQEK